MNSADSMTSFRLSEPRTAICCSWRRLRSGTSHLNLRIAMQLGQWADRDGTGLATESSGGFILRDSAVVAPDAAWILSDRLNAVPRERQERFLPLCPDFVIELLSPTDTLARTQAKMREYLATDYASVG